MPRATRTGPINRKMPGDFTEEILQGLSQGPTIPREIPMAGLATQLRRPSFPTLTGLGAAAPAAAAEAGSVLPSAGKGLMATLGAGAAALGPLGWLGLIATAPFVADSWYDLYRKITGQDPESKMMEAQKQDRKAALLANAMALKEDDKRTRDARIEGVFDKALQAQSQQALLDTMGPMGQTDVMPGHGAMDVERAKAAQVAAMFNGLQSPGTDLSQVDPMIREGIF